MQGVPAWESPTPPFGERRSIVSMQCVDDGLLQRHRTALMFGADVSSLKQFRPATIQKLTLIFFFGLLQRGYP